jgi:hypothetical protein
VADLGEHGFGFFSRKKRTSFAGAKPGNTNRSVIKFVVTGLK